MSTTTPVRAPTPTEIEKARTKGQVIGWLQGSAATVAGLLLLKLVGWIPIVAALAIGGYFVVKLVSKRK